MLNDDVELDELTPLQRDHLRHHLGYLYRELARAEAALNEAIEGGWEREWLRDSVSPGYWKALKRHREDLRNRMAALPIEPEEAEDELSDPIVQALGSVSLARQAVERGEDDAIRKLDDARERLADLYRARGGDPSELSEGMRETLLPEPDEETEEDKGKVLKVEVVPMSEHRDRPDVD